MNNHYKILNLSPDSTQEDIKKAYFRLVRKYPPDKEPEQFMAIREAYEALSNEKTRLEYDRIFLMDATARLYYQKAKEFIGNRQYKKAVELLKEAFQFYPQVTLLHEMYGDALLFNGNCNKASQVYTLLTEKNPGHAGFLGKLANAQVRCGWRKKAYDTYQKALRADRENLSIWDRWIYLLLDLDMKAEALTAVEEAMRIAADNDSDIFSFLFVRIHLCYVLHEPQTLLLDYIDQIIGVANRIGEEEKENVGWFLYKLVETIHPNEEFSFTEKLIEKVKTIIPQESEKLDKILFEDREQQILIPKYNQFISEEEEKVDPLVFSHVNFFLPPYKEGFHGFASKENYDAARLISEYMLLSTSTEHKDSLLFIKRNYPEIYEVFNDLFTVLQKPFEAARQANAKFKRMQMDPKVMQMLTQAKSDFEDADEAYAEDGWDEDEDDYPVQIPYVRETPKVGRNDPCPCGSGKKYKKCCGK